VYLLWAKATPEESVPAVLARHDDGIGLLILGQCSCQTALGGDNRRLYAATMVFFFKDFFLVQDVSRAAIHDPRYA
jgi:hypothetical protein